MPRSRPRPSLPFHTRRPAAVALSAAAVPRSSASQSSCWHRSPSGCGDAGGLRGARVDATAVSPARLWPELPPASSPALDYGEADTETVKGITAPGDDIQKVDPVAVVRAGDRGAPRVYYGRGAAYDGTARRMADCGEERRAGAQVSRPQGVLPRSHRRRPRRHGAGFPATARQPDGRTRVHLPRAQAGADHGRTTDAVAAVELAGPGRDHPRALGDRRLRVPPQWTWDADQQAMLLTSDEILRTGPRRPKRAHAPPAPLRHSLRPRPPPRPPAPPRRAADETRAARDGPAPSP